MPCFREKIIRDIIQKGKDTKGKATASEGAKASVDASMAKVLRAPIHDEQVPMIIVSINAQIMPNVLLD